MKHLNPNVIWLFFIQNLIGLSLLLFSFSFFIIPMVGIVGSLDTGLSSLIVPAIILACFVPFILVVVLSYLFAKLTYNNYKYELKEDGFYKESGVIVKRYVTIPYERIQNIDIVRGVFARLLGLSDLQIQTAGMSMSYGGTYGSVGSEGRLPGLSIAEGTAVRDELVKRAKGAKTNSGL